MTETNEKKNKNIYIHSRTKNGTVGTNLCVQKRKRKKRELKKKTKKLDYMFLINFKRWKFYVPWIVIIIIILFDMLISFYFLLFGIGSCVRPIHICVNARRFFKYTAIACPPA